MSEGACRLSGEICEQLPRGVSISPSKRRVSVEQWERRHRTGAVHVGEAAKPYGGISSLRSELLHVSASRKVWRCRHLDGKFFASRKV